MMRFIVVLMWFFGIKFHAQMLDNEKGDLFSETPFFNSKYIRSVNLKSIKGTISTKKELGTIKNIGKKEAYIFNRDGELTTHYLSKKLNSKNDTVFTFYEYNSDKKNTVYRVSDSYGFYSYTNSYDSQNRIISKTFSREKNSSKSKRNFKLAEKYIIFKEVYKYSSKDSIDVVTTLNSNGRPYQIEKKYYNKNGYLKKSDNRLLISNKKSHKIFSYNDKGFLKSVKYFKEKDSLAAKEIKFDYDEWGNVTFIDEYKNNERITHKELLYNPSNLILKTLLSQDLVSNVITITKFKPEFYNH